MVCRPVIIDPIAARRTRIARDERADDRADHEREAKPWMPRAERDAPPRPRSGSSCRRAYSNTAAGDGSTELRLPPDQHDDLPDAEEDRDREQLRPRAAQIAPGAARRRRHRQLERVEPGELRRGPRHVTAMAPYLLAQLVGDRRRERRRPRASRSAGAARSSTGNSLRPRARAGSRAARPGRRAAPLRARCG